MEWVALAYHIPSGASKNRVYIWRKLREYGAGSLRPGFAVLPDSGENRRRLRELSRKLKELGGDGTLMTLRLLDEADETALLEQFARQAREGYGRAIADGLREFAGAAKGLLNEPAADEGGGKKRTVPSQRHKKSPGEAKCS